MLAWMAYAMFASAALSVTAWLIDFAVAGRVQRRRVLWAGVMLASAFGPLVFAGAAATASARTAPILSDRMLCTAWLAASTLCMLWLVATHRRLRRQLQVYPSRIVEGTQVLVSPDFGPAVVGIVRPRIVLPVWALAMREDHRRIVVTHEAEHRQAHDPLLAALALFVAAAFPWNAALWWQLRRLRLAIEIDCDHRVVSKHSYDAHEYGMLLLATRERVCGATPAMALALAAMRSGLGRRVEALANGRPRPVVRQVSALAAAAGLSAALVQVPVPPLSMIGEAAAAAPASVAEAPPRYGTRYTLLVTAGPPSRTSVRAIRAPLPSPTP